MFDTDTLNIIAKENRQENRDYSYKMNVIEQSLKAVDPRYKIVIEEDLSYLSEINNNVY